MSEASSGVNHIGAGNKLVSISACELAQLADQVLKKGAKFRFHASGNSMHPLIKNGNAIQVSVCDFYLLKPGDIILARLRSGLVLVHRVIRVSETKDIRTLEIMGDNSLTSDGPVRADEYIGLVTAVERGGRMFDLRKSIVRYCGWLLGCVEAKRTRLAGARGGRKWLRRLLTIFMLLLRRLVLPAAYIGGHGVIA
ncbi:MAG: S24/S26 family peptidase [Thermoleophilia bacterium]